VAVGSALVLLALGVGLARRTVALTSEEWAVAVFLGWGVVSAVFVGMSPLASRLALTNWLVALIVWVVSRRARPPARRMAASVLLAAAILLVAGIFLEVVGRGAIRVGGLLENPNIAAALVVVAVPLAMELRGESGRGWCEICAALLVLGVILTGSRAGLLAVLAGGAVVLPAGRLRRAGLAFGGLAAGAVVLWRFVSQPDVLAWFRPTIWLAVLRLWWSRPLTGVGPGGLVDAAGPVRVLHDDHLGQRQFLIAYAESSPLSVLVQTGLVGAAIAAAVLFLWFRRARVNGALAQPSLRAAVVSMAVMALFHDFVNLGVALWWWAAAVGLLESGHFHPRPGVSLPLGPRVLRGMVFAFLVLWGMVGPAWAKWLWWNEPRSPQMVNRVQAAEGWYAPPLEWRARQLLAENLWTWPMAAEAVARSQRAVAVHPGSSTLWMNLGHVHSRIIGEFGGWPDSIREARRAFARAAELEPHQPWPWMEAARLERVLGDLDRAAVFCRRAVAAEPHAVRAWLLLARIELDRANLESARGALQHAESSARLARRPGLKAYERELLAAPAWQFRELREALR
jgi:tetratricopeptide (TPR) repeat protein